MFRRYAFVRQNDESDCGAACLATVALQFGRPVSLEQMRRLTGTDRIGTNLLALRDAAEKMGFSARGVQGPYDALRGIPLPAIAHVHLKDGLGHFIVVHRVRKDSVTIADPGHTGVETLSRKAFCERWTGNLLLLVPDLKKLAVAPGGIAPSAVQRLMHLLSGHIPVLAEAFFCALLMTLLGVSTSFYIQHLVDSVLLRDEKRLLNCLGVGMIAITAFRTIFGMLRQYLLAHTSRKIDLTLMAGYMRHLLRLPMQFFETRRVGEILSRIRDADKVRDAISGTTLTAVVDATVVLLTLVVLYIYDWPLALAATAFVPLLMLSVVIFHPSAQRKSRQSQEQAARLSAHLVEDITGVETIKAYGAERRRTYQGEEHLVGLEQVVFGLQKLGLSMGAVGTFVTGVASITILWYGGTRVMKHEVTVGELMFFYSLLNYLLDPLQRLAQVNIKLQEALTAVDRLYQVLDLEVERSSDRDQVAFEELREGIVLRDVGFRYGSRGQALDNVRIRIPTGWTVAIVGESGSGKSTLLKLLMGYYEPTAGRLLVDGVDIRDLDLTDWRRRVGLVSQEPFIFNGTIRDNIALGAPEATQAQVVEAARVAGLEDFINTLPERYGTMIGERGANMSGGQRQRLAIARALVRQPDVLIFDEATSHLDTATEQAIQGNLRGATAGRTVVVVAHRLSTIKDADYIYVLDKGKVVERGSHRQLLELEGRYANLWRAQTGEASPSRPYSRRPAWSESFSMGPQVRAN
jgi:ATP-binding cassette subfamily B protein